MRGSALKPVRSSLASCIALCMAFSYFGDTGIAETPAPPRAARSVHLDYRNPFPTTGCTSFYLEVTIQKSTHGSYFQACGFSHGYFGIQELGDGKKVAIFSVWDPTNKGNDPKAVSEEDRCEVLYTGAQSRVKRFGGEGTGAQCMLDFAWQPNQPVAFYLTAAATDGHTIYDAYIRQPDGKTWYRLASFRTRTDGKLLQGLYSFVEDFRRDTASVRDVRRAVYLNGWVSDGVGGWASLSKAAFTASDASWESKPNADAGPAAGGFFLQTGGDTKMNTPLGTLIHAGESLVAK